jgi:hypothetical protein
MLQYTILRDRGSSLLLFYLSSSTIKNNKEYRLRASRSRPDRLRAPHPRPDR